MNFYLSKIVKALMKVLDVLSVQGTFIFIAQGFKRVGLVTGLLSVNKWA